MFIVFGSIIWGAPNALIADEPQRSCTHESARRLVYHCFCSLGYIGYRDESVSDLFGSTASGVIRCYIAFWYSKKKLQKFQ